MSSRLCFFIALGVVTLALEVGAPAFAQLLVANDGSDPGAGQAWNVDPADGSSDLLWGTSAGINVWGMAYDPVGEQLYASSGAELFAGPLDGGAPSFVGFINDGVGNNLTFPGLAWANGSLYGTRAIDDEAVFRIDAGTWVATPVLDYPELEYDFGGFAFNPADGLFYGTSDSLAAGGVGLYSLDVFGSGDIQLVVNYPSGLFDVDGLAIGDNVAYLVEDSTGDSIHPYDLVNEVFLDDITSPFPTSEVFSAAAYVPSSMVGCDLNSDGVCDCADVDSLTAAIASGTHDEAFDLTGDGMVNGNDLDEWLMQAGSENLPSGNAYLAGDANLDGTVDGADFIIWNTNKFTMESAWCHGDFNADGTVDGGDFILWNANKFSSSAPSPVPEPCGLVWLGCALAFLTVRSRVPTSA